MYTSRFYLLRAFFACNFLFFMTQISWLHAAEQITPDQARAMIVRFWSSPEGGKLVESIGIRSKPSAYRYKAFYDPRESRIRWGVWRVDPINRLVLAPSNACGRLMITALPSDDSRLEGSFVKEGEDYVVKNARVVKVTTIKPEEIKPMLLDFLSSPQAAEMPSWVSESRKLIKSSEVTTISTEGSCALKIGPWLVDPMFETVLLVTDSAEFNGRIAREGEKYMIKDAVVQEERMIKPEEAKGMILHFLDSEDSQGVKNLVMFGLDFSKEREYAKSHNLSLSKAHPATMYADPSVTYEMGSMSVGIGIWSVNPVTHDFRFTIPINIYTYSVFVREQDKYTMYQSSSMYGSSPSPKQ